jgi:hypothetical protein
MKEWDIKKQFHVTYMEMCDQVKSTFEFSDIRICYRKISTKYKWNLKVLILSNCCNSWGLCHISGGYGLGFHCRASSSCQIHDVGSSTEGCFSPNFLSSSMLIITVAASSKACTVFARSEAGIVGSNPTQGMDIWCVCVFLCLCTGRGLATIWSPAQGVLPNV